jgi:hypothetical protein
MDFLKCINSFCNNVSNISNCILLEAVETFYVVSLYHYLIRRVLKIRSDDLYVHFLVHDYLLDFVRIELVSVVRVRQLRMFLNIRGGDRIECPSDGVLSERDWFGVNLVLQLSIFRHDETRAYFKLAASSCEFIDKYLSLRVRYFDNSPLLSMRLIDATIYYDRIELYNYSLIHKDAILTPYDAWTIDFLFQELEATEYINRNRSEYFSLKFLWCCHDEIQHFVTHLEAAGLTGLSILPSFISSKVYKDSKPRAIVRYLKKRYDISHSLNIMRLLTISVVADGKFLQSFAGETFNCLLVSSESNIVDIEDIVREKRRESIERKLEDKTDVEKPVKVKQVKRKKKKSSLLNSESNTVALDKLRYATGSSVLLPVGCGISRNMISKMTYQEYSLMVRLHSYGHGYKSTFKRAFVDWCKRVHDRRFNCWTRFYKALSAGKYVPVDGQIIYSLRAVSEGIDDIDLSVVFNWKYRQLFVLCVSLLRAFYSKDAIQVGCCLTSIYMNSEFKELCSLLGECITFDELNYALYDVVSESPVEEASLLNKLIKVIGLAATSSLLTVGVGLEPMLTTFKSCLDQLKHHNNLLTSLFDFLKVLRERLVVIYNTGDISNLFKGSYVDWTVKVRDITRNSVLDVYRKLVLSQSFDMQISELDKLIKQGTQYDKSGILNIEDRFLFNKLLKQREKLISMHTRMENRKPPLAVIMFGEPGLGKTYFSDLLCLYAKQALGEAEVDPKPGDVYEVPLYDKHWNNMSPNLYVVLLNDLRGSCHDMNSPQIVPDLMQRLVDPKPFMTPQADIDDKMDSVISPTVVFITSNDSVLDFRKLGNDWTKLERRYKYSIKVEFPPNHNHNITVSDDLELLNRCSYKLYQMRDDHGLVHFEGEFKQQFSGVAAVCKFLRNLVKTHVETPGPLPVNSVCPLGLHESLHNGSFLCENCPFSREIVPFQAQSEGPNVDNFVVTSVYSIYTICILPYFLLLLLYKYLNSKLVDFRNCLLDFMAKFESVVNLCILFKATFSKDWQNFVSNVKKAFVYVLTLLAALLATKQAYVWFNKKEEAVKAESEVVANPVTLADAENLLPLNMRNPPFEPMKVSGVPKFPYGSYNPIQLCAGINDFEFDKLKMKVCSNVVKIFVPDEHVYGSALMVNSNLLVLNWHIYNSIINKYGKTDMSTMTMTPNDVASSGIKFHFNFSQKMTFVKKDLVFVKVPTTTFCDLSRFFINPGITPQFMEGYLDEDVTATFWPQLVVQTDTGDYVGDVYSYPKRGPGLCGTPLLLIDRSRPVKHGCIAGIHFAGSRASGNGMAMVITSDDIKMVIEQFNLKPVEFVVPSFVNGFKSEIGEHMQLLTEVANNLPIPISPLGTFGPMKKTQGKSQVIHTDMYNDVKDDFVEPKCIPRLHVKGEIQNGVWTSPVTHKLLSFDVFPKRIDFELLDRAVKDYLTGLPPPLVSHPLSIAQAVNGIVGNPLYKGINLNSSSGSARFYIKDKKDLVNRESIDKDLVRAIVAINQSHDESRPFINYQRWCLKDEPVTIKKDKLLKFRFFMVSELAPLINARRLLLPIINYMYTHKEFFECYGAFNPASAQFDALYKRMSIFRLLHCFDVKHMDTSHKNFMCDSITAIFYHVARHLGYSLVDAHRVSMILIETVFSVIEYNNDLYLTSEGMGSGLFVTFFFNSLSLSILYRAAFLKLFPDRIFRDYCRLTTGGDDSIFTTSLVEMHGAYVAETFLEFGYELTSARKNQSLIEDFTPWEEFVFLKRTPRFEPIIGCYIGVLDLDSILKNMAYVLPSKSQPLAEQMAQKADAAARELALHDQETFDKYISILKLRHPEVKYYSRDYYLTKYYAGDLYEEVQRADVVFEDCVSEMETTYLGNTYVEAPPHAIYIFNKWDWVFYFSYMRIIYGLYSNLLVFFFNERGMGQEARSFIGLFQCLYFVHELQVLDYPTTTDDYFHWYLFWYFIFMMLLNGALAWLHPNVLTSAPCLVDLFFLHFIGGFGIIYYCLYLIFAALLDYLILKRTVEAYKHFVKELINNTFIICYLLYDPTWEQPLMYLYIFLIILFHNLEAFLWPVSNLMTLFGH